MDVLGRWWNGAWGRPVRRDVWLLRDTRWRVVARQSDSDTGKTLEWDFATEEEARAMIDRLLKAEGPGKWKVLDHVKMSPPWGYGRWLRLGGRLLSHALLRQGIHLNSATQAADAMPAPVAFLRRL